MVSMLILVAKDWYQSLCLSDYSFVSRVTVMKNGSTCTYKQIQSNIVISNTRDPINWFNPAIYVYLYQSKT